MKKTRRFSLIKPIRLKKKKQKTEEQLVLERIVQSNDLLETDNTISRKERKKELKHCVSELKRLNHKED